MFKRYLVAAVISFLLIFCLSPDVFARPKGQTATKKFKPYTGIWEITTPDSPLQGANFELLFERDEILEVNRIIGDEGFIGLITGRPGRTNARKRKFKTRYSILDETVRLRLGIGGDVNASVPKGNNFSTLDIVLTPDDKSLSPHLVRAERVADLEGDSRTILYKMKRKGDPRVGGSFRVQIKAFNRGRSLVQNGQMTVIFDVSGPVASLELNKPNRLGACELIGTSKFACSARYLGPKNKSVISAVLRINVSEDAKIGDEIVVILDATTDSVFEIDSRRIGSVYRVR